MTGPDVDAPQDEGAMTPEQMEEVQAVVHAGQPAVTRCYTEELSRRADKSFKGKVTVKILIGTQQAAQKVEIGPSELNAPAVHDCIRETIMRWEFPALVKPNWFTYPFQFSPAY